MLNSIEQNIILYYADYLSLKLISIPVTDNCKYYFIHGIPTNSAYIVGLEPFYDTENLYYLLAYMEYKTLLDNIDEDAINSFIENICNLKALGCINAEDMLKCIHRFSTKGDRKAAFMRYERWKNSLIYTHTVFDDKGDEIEQLCTRYIAHHEYETDPKKRIRYIERVSVVPEIQGCCADNNGTTAKDS